MNKNLDLGKLELKSAPGKAFLYFAIVVFIVFTAICGFIYFGAIVSVNEGRSSFNGDISILYKAIAGIMILAVIILITAVLSTKGNTFYFYGKGIIAANKGKQKTILYADIQDVYLFTSGKRIFGPNNVAYRTDERSDWQPISVKYSNYGKAIQLIRTRQQEAYVPKTRQHLTEGKSVTFHYIEYSKVIAKQIFALGTESYLNVTPKTILLYKNKLIIGHETINLADVQSFSINDWTNQIKLLNKENKTLFSISFYSVFSGDSFVALLDELINKQ